MCGIAGYSKSYYKNLDSEVLNQSINNLMHRGPDDTGIYEDKKSAIGVAHSRLSILDLSPLGHQPMFSDDGDVILVFNGEIYNFLDIKRELLSEGHVFKGNSDTEVLLNLYLHFKSSKQLDFGLILRKLNGIFAFAIVDKHSNSLILARDAIGVKPLYYSTINHGGLNSFYFSSEIKSLISMIPLVGNIDVKSINRYLTYLWCPGPGTPLENIKKIEPGEYLIIKYGVIQERHTWYKLPRYSKNTTLLDKKNAIRDTEKILRLAVHRQMVADVDVGAFLSGGLDSSSIVAFAKEIKPDIHCFTIDVKGGMSDDINCDLPYAKIVSKHLNVKLDIVSVDPLRIADDLEKMIFQLDEPLADLSALNVFYISQLAKNNGIKVLLSGAGGDDFFSGYRRHQALAFKNYISWMPESALLRISELGKNFNEHGTFSRRIKKLLSGFALKGDALLVNYFRWIDNAELIKLYSNDFKVALKESMAEDTMLKFLSELPGDTNSLDRLLGLEQRFFLPDHNLNYTDKMSMSSGVEVRVPFLDLDLIDFCSTLPNTFKMHGFQAKWILKKAMETYLPKKIIYRPKTGFGLPLRRWINHELREIIQDYLSYENLEKRGLFDPKGVHSLISNNKKGLIDASYTIFSLLCIEIWCRNYLDVHSKNLT